MRARARIPDIEKIEMLGLPRSTTNRLRAHGVASIAHLCALRASDLLKMRGVGERSVNSIRWALERLGCELRAEDEVQP